MFLDSNLVLSLHYTGSYVAPRSLPALLDEAGVKSALDLFWNQAGKALVEDYLDGL